MPFPQTLLPPQQHVAVASDQLLMTHIADADADAFAELYRRHIRRVLAQARKLCPNNEVAEEVAQETFISVWRSAHRYRPALGSASAWVSGIARNRAIDAWRRSAAGPVEVVLGEHDSREPQDAEARDVDDLERAAVLSLLATLPSAQKEAIFLAYFAGMTHDEIAAWADAPVGTIKGRIRLGVEKLRYEVGQESRPPRPDAPVALAAAPGAELECARRRRSVPAHTSRPITELQAA